VTHIVQGSKRRAKPKSSSAVSDGRRARGQSTRDRILLKAERLFAESGIAAVSLRDVALAAAQKNNAAVHYHFGDKDGLVNEIALYRTRQIEERSLALQAQLFVGGKPLQVVDYVRAFVMPLESNIHEGNYCLPFLSRFHIEQGGIATLMDPAIITSVNVLRKGLRQALPDYPEALIEERWQILVISIVHSLASYQTAHRAGALTAPLDHLLDDLVRFHSAGLQAPPRSTQERASAPAHAFRRTRRKDSRMR
jgi:AcrR family transcriptional regulator